MSAAGVWWCILQSLCLLSYRDCVQVLGVPKGTILPYAPSEEAADEMTPDYSASTVQSSSAKKRSRPASTGTAAALRQEGSKKANIAVSGAVAVGSSNKSIRNSSAVGRHDSAPSSSAYVNSGSSSVSCSYEGGDETTAAGGEGEEEGSLEDCCFVCGLDGRLLICDFPGCTKVYHQVSE